MKNSIKRFGSKRYIPVMITNKTDPFIFPTNWKKDDPPYIDSFDELNTIYGHVRFNGVGMVLDDLYCIDIDIKKNPNGTNRKNGFNLFKIWCEDYDLDFSEFYCEQTRGGGHHYYFHNDVGFKSNNAFENSGIDLLAGEGKLTIIAGSYHYKLVNEGRIGRLSELPADFLRKIERKKNKKPTGSDIVEVHELVSFNEAVKVLSFFPEDYWDTNGVWHKYAALIKETFSDEDAEKILDIFMNETKREIRTGGKTGETNKQLLARPPSKHPEPFTWGGVRCEATDYEYIDPEVELDLKFLSSKEKPDCKLRYKKGDLSIPHGLAGEIVKDLMKNKNFTIETAIIFGSQMIPSYLYASRAYYEGDNLSTFVLQVGDSNAGKSFNVGIVNEALAQIEEGYGGGFGDSLPRSDSALMSSLEFSNVLNIYKDEAKNFFVSDGEFSPKGIMLQAYTARKGEALPGMNRETKKNISAIQDPWINLIMNDTFDNFDTYRTNEFFGGGGVRRFELIYVKDVKKTKDVYKSRRKSKKLKPLSKNTLDIIKRTLYKKEFHDINVFLPENLEEYFMDIQLSFDNHPENDDNNSDMFSYARDKVELFAARIALLNATDSLPEVAISKPDLDWAKQACLFFCLRNIELYENTSDELFEQLKKARKRITNDWQGFVGFTRQFTRNKINLLATFQSMVIEDQKHFEIKVLSNKSKVIKKR